jgi:CMP-N,N'-diacetyllegionaminic acid synthase
MIGGKRVLALIPARGGSKGVPRKNLRPLGGKPLLQWTADAANGSKYVDRVVLSTDDDEIATLGRSLGLDVPFLRPHEASTDEAPANAVVEHAIGALNDQSEYVVYLQPTSPFRSAADIDGCLERLVASDADACVSVSESPTKPEWLFYVGPDSSMRPVLGQMPRQRRQELERAFELNGAVYVSRIETYRRLKTFLTGGTVAWIMPPERSVDIDETTDFEQAEKILEGTVRH